MSLLNLTNSRYSMSHLESTNTNSIRHSDITNRIYTSCTQNLYDVYTEYDDSNLHSSRTQHVVDVYTKYDDSKLHSSRTQHVVDVYAEYYELNLDIKH